MGCRGRGRGRRATNPARGRTGLRPRAGHRWLGPQTPSTGTGAGRPTVRPSSAHSRLAFGKSPRPQRQQADPAAEIGNPPARFGRGAAVGPPRCGQGVDPPGQDGSRRQAERRGRTAGGHDRCRAAAHQVEPRHRRVTGTPPASGSPFSRRASSAACLVMGSIRRTPTHGEVSASVRRITTLHGVSRSKHARSR